MKDELGGKIRTTSAEQRAKTYIYLIDDGSAHKKTNGTKKSAINKKKA